MNEKPIDRIERAVYENRGALDAITDLLAAIAKGETVLAAQDLKMRHQRFQGDPPLEPHESHHWIGYQQTIERFERHYQIRKFGSPDVNP